MSGLSIAEKAGAKSSPTARAETDAPAVRGQRLQFLDALRALAIAMVVLVHVSKLYPESDWVYRLGSWADRGVQLFFIVSAYTLLSVDRDVALRTFFLRRVFRIAPMFYLAIVGYVALFGLGPQYYAPKGIGPLEIGLTFAFLHEWWPNAMFSVVPGGWSIGVEAMFYAAFKPLQKAVNSLPRAAAFCALSIVASLAVMLAINRMFGVRDETMRSFSYLNFVGQTPAFAIGFLVFFARRALGGWTLPPVAANLAIAALLAAMFALAWPGTAAMRFHLIADVLFGALVLTASLHAPAWLVNTATCYVGRVSYSVYIVHFAVIEVVRRGFAHSVALQWLAFPITLAASIAIAGLTYRHIEQPMIALGKRVTGRVSAPA